MIDVGLSRYGHCGSSVGLLGCMCWVCRVFVLLVLIVNLRDLRSRSNGHVHDRWL